MSLNKKLMPFLVGECDVVVAYNCGEARDILSDYMKEANEFEVKAISLNQEVTDEAGKPISTIGKMIKDVTSPVYLYGWD